jgi:hypothetical protein
VEISSALVRGCGFGSGRARAMATGHKARCAYAGTLLGTWQSLTAPSSDDHVNVALAGLAGRAWREGHLPDLPAVPGLRDMQRVQAFHLLRWLESRQP